MKFYTANYIPTATKSQENVIDVMRDIMISNLQDQLSDLQWKEESGEITDQYKTE